MKMRGSALRMARHDILQAPCGLGEVILFVRRQGVREVGPFRAPRPAPQEIRVRIETNGRLLELQQRTADRQWTAIEVGGPAPPSPRSSEQRRRWPAIATPFERGRSGPLERVECEASRADAPGRLPQARRAMDRPARRPALCTPGNPRGGARPLPARPEAAAPGEPPGCALEADRSIAAGVR